MDSGYISIRANTLQRNKAVNSTFSDFQSKNNTFLKPFSFIKMSFDLQGQKTEIGKAVAPT